MLDEHNRWRLDAACLGADLELFYPYDSRDRKVREHRLARARRFCAACPVRARCLDEADRVDDRFAIMGGLTYQERRAHRRQGGRPAEHLASALVGNTA